MSETIKVIINTSGGDEKELDAPSDMLASDFISDLVTVLQLPSVNSDGQLIVWRVDNKATGQTLSPDLTLAENNVQDGHHLSLLRDANPGAKESGD